MLCLNTYTNKTAKDFDSWVDWVGFVNENEKVKVSLFGWLGRCRMSDLPTFHPFWKWVTLKEDCNNLDKLKAKRKLVASRPELIKVYFNLNSTIQTIDQEIEKKQKDIERRFDELRQLVA